MIAGHTSGPNASQPQQEETAMPRDAFLTLETRAGMVA
jgi:hypothetical protein